MEKALECSQEELHLRSDLFKEGETEEVADCYGEIGHKNLTLGFINKALDIL